MAEHEVREYQHGLLVIDVVNRVTKNVVWRGWANGFDESTGVSQEKIDEIVFSMLSQFPPAAGR